MNKKQKNLLIRIITAVLCVLLAKLISGRIPAWYLRLAMYMVPYLIVGHDILRKAWHGIRNRQLFDENNFS